VQGEKLKSEAKKLISQLEDGVIVENGKVKTEAKKLQVIAKMQHGKYMKMNSMNEYDQH